LTRFTIFSQNLDNPSQGSYAMRAGVCFARSWRNKTCCLSAEIFAIVVVISQGVSLGQATEALSGTEVAPCCIEDLGDGGMPQSMRPNRQSSALSKRGDQVGDRQARHRPSIVDLVGCSTIEAEEERARGVPPHLEPLGDGPTRRRRHRQPLALTPMLAESLDADWIRSIVHPDAE